MCSNSIPRPLFYNDYAYLYNLDDYLLSELPSHDVTMTVENGNSRGENGEWSDNLPGATPHKVCIAWYHRIVGKQLYLISLSFPKLSVTLHVGVHWETINLANL